MFELKPGTLGILCCVATLVACGEGATGSAATGSAASTAKPAARASAKATASAAVSAAPSAAAAAPSDLPLAERFAAAAPAGIDKSAQRLGVPAGWSKGEFGEVKTENKDGYAAIYDLPQFPPEVSQVELRATSMGCRDSKLEPGVDGTVGAKKASAKLFQGKCSFDGAPAAIWAIAMNLDKNDNPKVIVIAVKDSARATLEAAVPAIAQAYAESF